MSGILSPLPVQKFFDNNGAPLASGKLYSYQAGTTTPQATYTDSTLGTPNTNPVIMNARGECNLWLDPTLSYKLLLQDSLGNQIPGWPVDNIQGTLSQSGSVLPTTDNAFDLGSAILRWRNGYFGTQLYVGANNTPVLNNGAVSYWPRTAAEIAAAVTPVNYNQPVCVVDRYATNTTPSTTDMLTGINNAIAVASAAGGGTVIFGANTYFHSAAIALNKYVTLQGAGRIATVLLSTHTGNGITSTWPVNSSTLVNEVIKNLTLKNTNASNTGSGFVDIGGTSVNLEQVKISGFKYSVIFDQTELADIDYCDFEFPLTAGIWIVNGGDYSGAATANAGYTNRISIYRTQFNQAVGTGTAIIDDGGSGHSFTDLNVNGFASQLRAADIQNLKISGGLWSAFNSPILFTNTTSGLGTSVSPCFGVLLDNVQIGPSGSIGACINIVALHQTQIIGGWMSTTAAAAITGAANATNLTAIGVAYNSTALADSISSQYLQADGVSGIQTNLAIRTLNAPVIPQRTDLTYGATIAVNAALGNEFQITVTNGTAFTISTPTGTPPDAQWITFNIRNTSGGVMGVVTWGTAYKMSAWTSPATANSRSISFMYDGLRGFWVEISRTPNDVPN